MTTDPQPGFDPYTPAQMAARVEAGGVAKAALDAPRTLVLAVLAGAFIGLGALAATVAGTSTGLGHGPTRLLMGVAFSLGLVLVIVGGAELFTGNALLVIAWADRRVRTAALLRNWLLCYAGNLAGALATAAGVHLSGVCAADTPVGATAIAIVNAKASVDWLEAFVRGVFGNALVCLAVWLCFSARTTTDRILCITLPVCAFVAVGFEHSIANLYFVPLGLWLQADAAQAPAWQGLVNVVPVTLGNLVGGACLVGLVYWFVYLRAPSRNAAGDGEAPR